MPITLIAIIIKKTDLERYKTSETSKVPLVVIAINYL